MTYDPLSEDQIETLADNWPWEHDLTARALRIAEREEWPLDDTVRALDALAATGNEDPVQIVVAAAPLIRRYIRTGDDSAITQAIARAFGANP